MFCRYSLNYRLQAGDIEMVILVNRGGAGCEVEFVVLNGEIAGRRDAVGRSDVACRAPRDRPRALRRASPASRGGVKRLSTAENLTRGRVNR